MTKRSLWSGVALILVGCVFIAATNSAGRVSRLGLIVGGAIIVLGLARMAVGRNG
jgi:hypothetical protein